MSIIGLISMNISRFTNLKLKALILVFAAVVVGNDLGGVEFVRKLYQSLASGNVLDIQGPKIDKQRGNLEFVEIDWIALWEGN